MKTRTQAVKELKEQMRGAGLDEVRAKRCELSDHLFRLRFQMAGGQSDTLRKIRELRRDIARVETILGEREAEKR